jgi:hypothetical protein
MFSDASQALPPTVMARSIKACSGNGLACVRVSQMGQNLTFPDA